MAIYVLPHLVTGRKNNSKNECTAVIELYEREYQRRYADCDADCTEEGCYGVEGVEGLRLWFENCSLAGVQSHHQVGEERKGKRNDGGWRRVLMEGDELWRSTCTVMGVTNSVNSGPVMHQ